MKNKLKVLMVCGLMATGSMVFAEDASINGDDARDDQETELFQLSQSVGQSTTPAKDETDAQLFKEFLGATYGELLNEEQYGQGVSDLIATLYNDDMWKGDAKLEGFVLRLLRRAVLQNKKMGVGRKQNDKIAEALGAAIALWTPGPIKGSVLPQLNSDFLKQLAKDERDVADRIEKEAARKAGEAEKEKKQQDKETEAAKKLTQEQEKKAAAAELVSRSLTQADKNVKRRAAAPASVARKQEKITYRVSPGTTPEAPATLAVSPAAPSVTPAASVSAQLPPAPTDTPSDAQANDVPTKRRRAPRKTSVASDDSVSTPAL